MAREDGIATCDICGRTVHYMTRSEKRARNRGVLALFVLSKLFHVSIYDDKALSEKLDRCISITKNFLLILMIFTIIMIIVLISSFR